MQIGFGLLGLAPCHFWSMTPIEFRTALEGWREAQGARTNAALPPTRDELDELMARFPD